MHADIRPGDLVLVRHAGLPKVSPCSLHLERELPLFQSVGRVDRIDERYGEHSVVVVFPTIACPPFGSAWVDTFAPGELVLISIPAGAPNPSPA
jgi:hypothetical protein